MAQGSLTELKGLSSLCMVPSRRRLFDEPFHRWHRSVSRPFDVRLP
jgi:hypothetical protein